MVWIAFGIYTFFWLITLLLVANKCYADGERDGRQEAENYRNLLAKRIRLHENYLMDLRQRCAEYVSERLRLDRASGVEFPLNGVESGINQLPLRIDRKDE